MGHRGERDNLDADAFAEYYFLAENRRKRTCHNNCFSDILPARILPQGRQSPEKAAFMHILRHFPDSDRRYTVNRDVSRRPS